MSEQKNGGILFAAKETGADEDTRLRALALSNLTAIHQKTGLGTLFAYCGAKASCAAKIAEAVDAGIIGYYMAKRGQNFDDGDGIVTAGIEATIRNVGRLAKEGMKETNDEIISIMIGS